MADQVEITGTKQNYFKLHVRNGAERLVEGCDSLDEALARASRKHEKDPCAVLWITDAANRMVLDEEELRLRWGS
jgi:hypothetical protein